jgi:hypothetical protein
MDKDLAQAIDLIEAGKEEKARAHLIKALKTDPTNDMAWLWMSTVVETRNLRQECLEEALKHNPRNKVAKRALQRLKNPTPPPAGRAPDDAPTQEKVPLLAHILCGWPLVLVFIGGAIGGALGGVAYALNVAIYKTNLPTLVKVILNVVIGLGAIGLWYVVGNIVASFL